MSDVVRKGSFTPAQEKPISTMALAIGDEVLLDDNNSSNVNSLKLPSPSKKHTISHRQL